MAIRITDILPQLKTALSLLIVFTLLTGLLYPLAITALATTLFPYQAYGSLLQQEGKTVASKLIGQSFTSNSYFWGRPSATTPYPYNGSSSAGSNSGPSNPDYLATVKQRVEQLRQAHPENLDLLIPVDLVTASASGLDPDISLQAAWYQIPRIAKARQLPEATLKDLIQTHTQERFLHFLGFPRVNVVQLNLALDALRTEHGRPTPQS